MPKKRIPTLDHKRTPLPANLLNHHNQNKGSQSKLRKLASKCEQKCLNFANSWNLALLAIILDAILNLLIIRNVSYTEIDWKTYMIQVASIFNNTNTINDNSIITTSKYNFDYETIEGPTGPLVYPAGHVYIFKILYELTDNGTNLLRAQYIYAAIYTVQLLLVFKIYSHKRVLKVPPYMFLFMTLTSYRIHSIYILRLFNDPIAILFAYASFYALLRKRHGLSAILFGIALSVKMNVLLYAPAFALIFYEDLGLLKSIKKALYVVGLHLLLAFPFLYTNPLGYLKNAFNFGRVFEHKWTVNWRFLDEQIFTSPDFFITLLAFHCIVLVYMFGSRWLQFVLPGRVVKFRDDPFLTLSISNFIGIAFSRTLHYQFYVWYYHSLPIILWATNYSIPARILLFGAIEFCWNKYPSTIFSSILLHSSHSFVLVSLLLRAANNNSNNNGNKKVASESR